MELAKRKHGQTTEATERAARVRAVFMTRVCLSFPPPRR